MSNNELIVPRPPEFFPDETGRTELVSDILHISGGGLPQLGVFKIEEQAIIPSKATKDSACFDISACLVPWQEIAYYDSSNSKQTSFVNDEKSLTLFSGNRYLIPTGLIFDIPKGFSVRLHPRSGLSLKSGLILANCEGVIDADYIEPVYVILINTSGMCINIKHGERICQGELVRNENYNISTIPNKPSIKTDRNGGFGSTGA